MSAKTVVRRFVVRDRRLPEPVTPVTVRVPANAGPTVVPVPGGGETHIAVSVGKAQLRGVSTVMDGRERLRASMAIPGLLGEVEVLARELCERGLLDEAEDLQDTAALASLIVSLEAADPSEADLVEVAGALRDSLAHAREFASPVAA